MARLELIINNTKADIDNDALVLFNYAMEDMTNPAIVKNSYSQTVKLKGTPTNNKIFSHIYRGDRLTFSGFNPQQRTPFKIMRGGEFLEQGYLKLDKVERNGHDISYNVTLYGGLGSFFYALSYREDGEKMTLADLDYMGNGQKISYQAYADEVKNAWRALDLIYDRSNKWHHINFAPCYNGIPADDFSADKAVFDDYLAEMHAPYPLTQTKDGNTYFASHFVQLSKEYDEWEMRDLRAYMQRPVVRMRSIVEAICDKAQSNGFSVSLDSTFFDSNNPYYDRLWMTRPLINSMEIAASSGTLDITIPSAPQITKDNHTAVVRLGTSIRTEGNVSISGTIEADIKVRLLGATLPVGTELNLRSFAEEYPSFKYTLRLKSFNGAEIGSIDTYVSRNIFVWDGSEATAHIAFELPKTTNVSWLEIEGSLSGGDFTLRNVSNQSEAFTMSEIYLAESGSDMLYEGGSTARSGSYISQDDILKTEGTPADYLLSLCKVFGLHFLFDKTSNTISIVTRNTLYEGAKRIDIDSRIDQSKTISTIPYVFDAKLYDFNVEYGESAFAEYYKTAHSRAYGLHRVNTGYAFDADHKDVMESVVFKGAPEVSARSRCFNKVYTDRYIPSVFVDAGHKVTYYRNGNAADTFDYDIPSASRDAYIAPLNPKYSGYDTISRLQFCDADNSPIDVEDVLVLYNGEKDDYAIVTDDNVAVESKYNDGIPCWSLMATTVTQSLPIFSRYFYSDNEITHSLDFGTPAEIDIPGIRHPSGVTIYERYWSNYLTDRYNVDTKVVTCNVDLRGIRVSEDMLRDFYYFNDAVWVLNKIINHSLSGDSTTTCEFIRVQNTSNYKSGQKI